MLPKLDIMPVKEISPQQMNNKREVIYHVSAQFFSPLHLF